MRGPRAALRRVRAELHLRTGGLRRARARLDGTCAAVLCYHRVLPTAEAGRLAVEPGMFVTPDTFRRHLAWLRGHFTVLSLGELVARLAAGRALPPRAAAITFDDGWRDNHEHAWPALREAGLPATIFLVTGRVGTDGAFWPDEVARRLGALPGPAREERAAALLGRRCDGEPVDAVLRHLKALGECERSRALERLAADTPGPGPGGRELLAWAEVDAMARDGAIDFESHGATHAILTGLPEARVDVELAEARRALAARGLGRHGLLAYPSGAFDARVVAAAGRAGHRAAFTTRPGLVSDRAPQLSLPRLLLHQDVSASRAEFLYRVPGRALPG